VCLCCVCLTFAILFATNCCLTPWRSVLLRNARSTTAPAPRCVSDLSPDSCGDTAALLWGVWRPLAADTLTPLPLTHPTCLSGFCFCLAWPISENPAIGRFESLSLKSHHRCFQGGQRQARVPGSRFSSLHPLRTSLFTSLCRPQPSHQPLDDEHQVLLLKKNEVQHLNPKMALTSELTALRPSTSRVAMMPANSQSTENPC
jgi:hypothetical protein